MDLRLLYFEGCPHRTVAQQRLQRALARIGWDGHVRHVRVETQEDAERLRFLGSPTILVDGQDPFARDDEQPGLACRVFSTPHGLEGARTVEHLVVALS